MATSVVSLYRDPGFLYRGDFDPSIQVTVQQFTMNDGSGDLRWRPIRVEGAVWDVGARSRDELVALADVRSDGTLDVRNPNFGIGGHLMAVSLNGVDEAANIAPVSKPTNDRMGAAERAIKKMSMGPRYLVVEIPSYYDGIDEDPRVPQEFRYSLYDKPFSPDLGDNDRIYRKRVRQDWSVVGPGDFPPREIANASQAAFWVRASGWCIEKTQSSNAGRDFSFLADHLPPLEDRPLAFLDYLIIAYPRATRISETVIAEYIRGIKLGGSFSRAAREIAIKGNMLRNNNWLVSDAYGKRSMAIKTKKSVVTEPFQLLSSGGGLNAPHVDHIVPMSLNGPNCFSNAQITSTSYNTQKGKRTKQFKFRSEEWKQAMIKTMKEDENLRDFID